MISIILIEAFGELVSDIGLEAMDESGHVFHDDDTYVAPE
jgi:hypothetical protein